MKQRPYSELVALVGHPQTKTVNGEDGKPYQLEAQALWEHKKGGEVLVIVLADDGGFRAFHPLSGSFIVGSDGYFAGE